MTSVGESLYVLDKTDQKPYLCKIAEVNGNLDKIRVHFVNWNSSHDEWLDVLSERIVDAPSLVSQSAGTSETPLKPADVRSHEIIGRLLLNASGGAKTVLSSFDYKADFAKNEKSFLKFGVPLLEELAEYLKIKIYGEDAKKLYNKKPLVSKLIKKLKSVLLCKCEECHGHYELGLDELPLFSCIRCDRGSHSCTIMKNFKSLMPNGFPAGFHWLCSECAPSLVSVDSYKGTSEPPSEDAVVTRNLVSSEESQSHLGLAQSNICVSSGDDQSHVTVRSPPPNVCPLYKKGKCPHGIRGNKVLNGSKCNFSHPRRCRRYCSFGSRGANGCALGSQCRFYHPILCRFSVNQGRCTNSECTFVHLGGTKRSNGSNTYQSNGSSRGLTAPNSDPVNLVCGGSESVPKNDFARLENMILDMRREQKKEINLLKSEWSLYIKQERMHPWVSSSPPPLTQGSQSHQTWHPAGVQSIRNLSQDHLPQIQTNLMHPSVGNSTFSQSVPTSYY